jgi:hypothetical protein
LAEASGSRGPSEDPITGQVGESAELPEVLCPDGSPPEGLTDSSSVEPPVPGVSPLDEAIGQIRQALDASPGTEGGAQ